MCLRRISQSVPRQTDGRSAVYHGTPSVRGFTLVEILVTLTVLSLALPALMFSFRDAARGQAVSENQTTALHLLKFRMAEIELGGYPDIGDDEGEFGENSRYGWRSEVQDVESDEIVGLRRVVVTVTWQEQGREKSISMNTYMADRQMQQQGQGGGQQNPGGSG